MIVQCVIYRHPGLFVLHLNFCVEAVVFSARAGVRIGDCHGNRVAYLPDGFLDQVLVLAYYLILPDTWVMNIRFFLTGKRVCSFCRGHFTRVILVLWIIPSLCSFLKKQEMNYYGIINNGADIKSQGQDIGQVEIVSAIVLVLR